MQKYATKGLKEDINKFVEQQENIPFTMKNIYRMLEIVIGTQSQRMDKAMIEVFDKVTERYSENRYNLEGWKANSHYLVNKKFINPYGAELTWSGKVRLNRWGGFGESERKTGVNVSLIKLIKPGASYKSEFEGFFMDEDEPEQHRCRSDG